MIKLFITATDTDAGKTYVAQSLITALVVQQLTVAVYKPISAGCDKVEMQQGFQLVNEDALLLANASNCQQSLANVNPIAFEEPIAPHIAAQKHNKVIDLAFLDEHYQSITNNHCDVVITEGAGGWRLPLGNGQFLSQFVQSSKQDVILVVNMKLGCLNHAILTYQAIVSDGLTCVGWVANCLDNMPYLEENIAELSQFFPMPLLAQLDKQTDIQKAAAKFNLQPLLAHL
ncbi:dethiobiotin synthase [Thalassotalea castellviae]|uniref:ATP-dependent dethiobiotin synthetase BioD n=1 Tax=Thalassotalea castellviae TaxID=3075612 RepID=A0ABU2ZWF5_9GAMM|nr:dethiobiotin synthase [Thalassotalea sp. W431]MDT0602039.1 dethiobiotin synthase [Thalassotalea sp. W431]